MQKPCLEDPRCNNTRYSLPAGHELRCSGGRSQPSRNGCPLVWRVYEGALCDGCEHKKACCPKYKKKKIRINRQLERHKNAVRERLGSSEGRRLRRLRGVEVETVFAQIKHNMGFRRFTLRGLQKVNTEMGLLAMAHNVKKLPVLNERI